MNRKPSTDGDPEVRDEQWRAELASTWAGRLARGGCLSRPDEDVEERLRELVDAVAETWHEPQRWDGTGRLVGQTLVDLHAVGPPCLSESLALLRDALLDGAGDTATERVFALDSAVAAGYVAADQERHVGERRFREVFTAAPIGVAICELDGSITEVNVAFEDILGHPGDALLTRRMHDLFHPEDRDYLAAVYADLVHGGSYRLREPRRLLRGDGDEVWTYLAVSVLYDDCGAPRGLVTMVEDISELTHLQERLQYQALHDAMTGLPNRQYFRTQLEATLVNCPPDSAVTLYHLGLDGFQLINDGLGFDVGDTVVKVVARRLATLVGQHNAMLARLGGTEFALLVVEAPEGPGVAGFAAKINEVLSEPIVIGEHGIATSASIGVARRAAGDDEPTDMLWASDVALRWAEDAGKRQWALFDPDRAPRERTDAQLAAVMPGALHAGEFEVLFQPLINMVDGVLVGVEAQLSWDTAEYGRLDHGTCLRLAERSGVTLALRDWLLRTAWEHVAEWHSQGYLVRTIVGLSPNQSQDPDLVGAVRTVLDAHDVDPQWLRLCMPVSAVMHESGEASENIHVLHDIGVQPAVHDFDASPRQLRRVRDLPVHAVQISGELVDLACEPELGVDSPEFVSIATVVSMVRDHGVPIAVGGLDTEEQAARWHAMGCEIGVGTCFGGPILPWEVPELLQDGPESDSA